MKSKNVIVLLLSLTLSLVANSMPVVDRDIGAGIAIQHDVVLTNVSHSSYEGLAIVPTILGPVIVRTVKENTNTATANETRITILPKCRDVDLCSSILKYNKNSLISISIRNRTAYLPRGGGSHGSPV